ncbi:hypothetical protein M2347_001160 [Chryseobacterium sp. H1D6B]|uniref:hypothetical protein n=1 Tax=Chryseobacterium sp. H1D6B TaxID=2940588 RepID=UPI0015C8C479|nr:hypothetical protein [Chryseobacterium sp. H1D6B]MDH6251433.1 hypothetical protein [Chryseobacterium sp. H1D6B]
MDINKNSLYFFRNETHYLKDNFIIHDEELFRKFNISIEHLCYFTLAMDKIIDGDYLLEVEKNLPCSAVKSYQESIKTLSKIFPDDHEFWNSLDKNNNQYYTTLLNEKQASVQLKDFTIEDFEKYAVGKHVLAYVPIIGLEYIFKPRYPIQKLIDIYTLIFKGIQMNDDIEDFHIDTLNNQWTYARSRARIYIHENNITNEANLDRFEERVLYVSGIVEELIDYSKEKFILAKNIADENGFKTLSTWLNETISDIRQNEDLISKLIKDN